MAVRSTLRMKPENIPEPVPAGCKNLRTQLRAARLKLSSQARAQGAAQLGAQLDAWFAAYCAARQSAHQTAKPRKAPVLAAYWPLAGEPDLRPWLARQVAAGVPVALPVVVQRHAPLGFRLWRPATDMAAGAYRIPEPQNSHNAVPEVLLVPTLGYTESAYRLGYGGGYYDRTLAALRAQSHAYIAIGIAWTCGRLKATDWQPGAHDMPLHAVLTPAGWVPAMPH